MVSVARIIPTAAVVTPMPAAWTVPVTKPFTNCVKDGLVFFRMSEMPTVVIMAQNPM